MSIQFLEDSIPGQLDAIKTRMDAADIHRISIDTRLQALETSMGGLREAVGYNTAMTTDTSRLASVIDAKLNTHFAMLEDMKPGWIGRKWAKNLLIGAGAIATAGAAVVVAFASAVHWLGGKP